MTEGASASLIDRDHLCPSPRSPHQRCWSSEQRPFSVYSEFSGAGGAACVTPPAPPELPRAVGSPDLRSTSQTVTVRADQDETRLRLSGGSAALSSVSRPEDEALLV